MRIVSLCGLGPVLGREDVKVGTVRLEALRAKEIERLTDGQGYEAYIRPGELYWRIHFAPFGKPKKDPARFGLAVYLAYSDMLKVVRWLGGEMARGQLHGANAVVATSRDEMITFAIKRFGFHKVAGYKHHRGFEKAFVRIADLVGREAELEAIALSLAKKYRRA